MVFNMDAAKVRFSNVDFAVFAIMLLISVVIGFYYAFAGGRQKTTAEFLLANRKMMSVPIALSLLASFMSAITILGVPAEIYTFGTQYWMIITSYLLLFPCVALVFVPVFRAVEITSSYEYLEKRFSFGVRSVASILFIIQTCLYMAIVTYGPSLAMEAVTGFPVWISILAIGIACTIYTTIGGIKAVIWNDVIQVLVMLGGLIAIVVVGSQRVGGFARVWHILEKGQRLTFFDFNPNPTQRVSFWSLVIGGAIGLLPLWAVNQTAVQRYLAAKSDKDARRSVWLNAPLSIFAVSLCALCGCVLYAFYHDCDPKTKGFITSGDQILPYFVMHVLGDIQGIAGLFLACLLSGTLSTLSSGLNSLAAVVLEDIIKPITRTCSVQLSDNRATIYTKVLALVFGILTIALSFLARELGAILTTFYRVFGIVGGPVVSVFLLGMLTRKANTRGVYAGLVAGFTIGLWIAIGSQVYPPPLSPPPVSTSGCTADSNVTLSLNITTASTPARKSYEGLALYRLSFLWYSTACLVTTFIVGILVSYVFPGNHDSEAVDPRLLFHLKTCFSLKRRSGREELCPNPSSEDVLCNQETAGYSNEQKPSLLSVTYL